MSLVRIKIITVFIYISSNEFVSFKILVEYLVEMDIIMIIIISDFEKKSIKKC